MFQKKRAININENSIDLPIPKQQKKAEALQELVHTKPNLKGKMVYFFPTLDKYFEGVLMYEIKDKKAYVYSVKDNRKFDTFSKWIDYLGNRGYFKGRRSATATIFLEANPTSPSIASILSTSNSLYWKTSLLINTTDILSSIQEKVKPGGEFSGTAIRKISEGLELHFFKEEKSEKKLLILTKSGLYRYEVYIFDQIVKEKYLPFPTKEMKRTLDEIINFIRYVFSVSICYGQSTAGN
ncbi:hypothetical protein RirG_149280 [Rhizophagus irregularis DAOM 197198w]|uniref:Uncharacterized protein n=1 Tax=Rhizophagus irregularis (strain DAOM 197198w) TaxID=1432141 RepID=A0A015KUY5_RHIIW|nr:hypothetical protein RirG_149280 [Rhizophagus irregularis DAOM 197198w]